MATTDEFGVFVAEETDLIVPFHTYLNTAMATVSHAIQNILPVGAIVPFAGKVAPSGWELCHGGSVNKKDYPEFFKLVGYTYGGSGDNVGVPDMRTRVPVGYDPRNQPFHTLGAKGGAKEVTLSAAQMPKHAHTQFVTHKHEGGSSGGSRRDHNADAGREGFRSYKKYSQGVTTGTAGGGKAHNNLQPYIVLEYIIKIA